MAIAQLISTLVSQLGVTESQAQGGAGLLFSLLKEKMGGDFSQIVQAIPGAEGLIDAAPQLGGAAKLAGSLLGALGGEKAEGLRDLSALASGFSQLKLDQGMIAKFVPVVLGYMQKEGGESVMKLAQKFLA